MHDPCPPALRSFYSDTYASEHLCDHVLTRPEAHDWALVLPDYRSLVDPTDDAALLDVAASLFSDARLPAALALRQSYVQAILRTIDDALETGLWWVQHQQGDRFFVGLGLEGVLVFWDSQVIRSGYLPRDSALPPAGPILSRTINPLPRRDYNRRLGSPPPDTPRARYELFQATFFSVSRLYEKAYNEGEIQWIGSDALVNRPPRFSRWQQLLAGRPGREAVTTREADETACDPSA